MDIRVLIAEDSEPLRALMREMLVEDCDVVAEAADGREAVELFERERPDAVVMDVRMPGADGIEATEAIKSVDPSTVVVVCTGAGEEEAARATAVGADDHVAKPFQKPQLVEALRRAG
jgi:two-component system chemotaxis response regulator CheY